MILPKRKVVRCTCERQPVLFVLEEDEHLEGIFYIKCRGCREEKKIENGKVSD